MGGGVFDILGNRRRCGRGRHDDILGDVLNVWTRLEGIDGILVEIPYGSVIGSRALDERMGELRQTCESVVEI